MSIDSLVEEALNLYNSNKFESSIKVLQKIRVHDYKSHLLLGMIYYSQNKINLSEENLNLAYELHNKHPIILHYRAIVSRKKGNINQAKSDLLKAIKIDNRIESISELGRIYFDENNITEAKKYFEMALKIDSNHKKTNLRLGNMFMRINDYKKGIKHIRAGTGMIRFKDKKFEIIK